MKATANKRPGNKLPPGARHTDQMPVRSTQPHMTGQEFSVNAIVNPSSSLESSRPSRTLPKASPAGELNAVFRLKAPLAQSVKLAGDFTDWEKLALDMTPHRNGVWELEVSLEPGRHCYRFLVDGKWQDDPTCSQREPNAFGTANAVIEVR